MDMDSFLRSLGIVVSVRTASASDIPRVAQLTQRTNQFNLTTKRYTQEEIKRLLDDAHWLVLVLAVRDRFGAEGTVGVALVELEQSHTTIDTFLLSCRVLGRGIEQAFLACVVRCVRERSADPIHASYVPTHKNGQVAEFYGRHGFARLAGDDDVVIWQLKGHSRLPSVPGWIDCQRATICEAKAKVLE